MQAVRGLPPPKIQFPITPNANLSGDINHKERRIEIK